MGILSDLKRIIHLAHDSDTGIASATIGLARETISVRTPLDAASDTDYDYYLWTAPRAGVIKSVTVLPEGAVATSETEYVTVSICKGAAAATTVTALASIATNAAGGGAWAAYIPETITVDDADTFEAGEQLLIRHAKTGATSKAIPASVYTLEVEYS